MKEMLCDGMSFLTLTNSLLQNPFTPKPFTPNNIDKQLYTQLNNFKSYTETPFIPKTFYTRNLLHKTCFYARQLLPRTVLTPKAFYAKNPLHQTVFMPTTFLLRQTTCALCITVSKVFHTKNRSNMVKPKNVLHQTVFHTKHFQYQAPFTPRNSLPDQDLVWHGSQMPSSPYPG